MSTFLFFAYIIIASVMGRWYWSTTAKFYALESIQDKAVLDSWLVAVFWPFYLAWYWGHLAFEKIKRG